MFRFDESLNHWQKASAVIPSATQTFSKSTYFLPKGIAPQFAEKASRCYLWDIDDNKYVDFISSLLCISLGYCDPDVNQAVQKQLVNGSIFSLPHRLETEVAELIISMVPCAEMVRFGKNGSDATAAAVRLARAFTKRDKIAVCGYHGWQDWYIGNTTRDLGVPNSTKQLTHNFTYNDSESLGQLLAHHEGEFAAVIMEPMNVEYPEQSFLADVKALCEKHGALLIFDETITGFRFDLGGAQKLFDITPDLATFGKGLSNGLPLSAVTGRRDVMMLMEDIFFSGTFGGDTLALAAAKATLVKMQTHDVLGHIHQQGQYLMSNLKNLLSKHDLSDHFLVKGHPSWSFLMPTDKFQQDITLVKTWLTQELVARGILCIGSHNLNYAHQQGHIDALLLAYEEILPQLVSLDQSQDIEANIRGEHIQPVFKVR